MAEVGNGIFGEDCDVITGNQFRDPMVDFRVNVIGPAGQNDPVFAGFFQVCQRFLPFFAHVFPRLIQFLPAMGSGSAYFFGRNL